MVRYGWGYPLLFPMESSDAPATEPEDVLSPPSTEGVLCPPVPHSTPNEVYSLVFVLEEGKVLLGKKKNGYGKDSWNGLSGKVHTEERVEEGAVRCDKNFTSGV